MSFEQHFWGKIGEILQNFIFLNCFWFFILTKPWLEEYNVKTFAKNFFETFWPFPANTKGVKWKLPFWQHFFSSACIFGRKTIRPKIFFVRSKNTLEFCQKNFWQCGIKIEQYKRGPWGGNPCFPPPLFFPNPWFHLFLRKANHSVF